MNPQMQKIREQGLSLRMTFLLMLIISLGITVILLYMSYHSIQSFHSLADATDVYMELDDAATSLLSASDYLTEEAQCYTVMGERKHLDNYFREAETTRRREQAVALLKERVPNSRAFTELEGAMEESMALMNREYYAMRLVLEAKGDTDIPEQMRGITLSMEDSSRTDGEKMNLAARMLHDERYYTQKNLIREHLSECLQELKEGTHGTQNEMEQRMHRDLVIMIVFIVLQSAGLMLLLWITTSLGINPLLQAVERIKRDETLPIIGAYEFRYLAGTYNKMYSAYKKSINNLSFKASHDELTGVYNRAGYDLIKQGVDLDSTAFLLADADRFKNINDTNGHVIGDGVIQKIARVLKDNFRSDDYVCRIGGDEFMILMVHVDESVRHLIENKILQINHDLASTEDGLPPISVSVGVSLGGSKKDAQQRFHEADMALYHVKDHGRNGCSFYEDSLKSKA